MGQQSLAEFMGLHVHLDWVFTDNFKKNVLFLLNNFLLLGPRDPKKEQLYNKHGGQPDGEGERHEDKAKQVEVRDIGGGDKGVEGAQAALGGLRKGGEGGRTRGTRTVN